jgi:transposase
VPETPAALRDAGLLLVIGGLAASGLAATVGAWGMAVASETIAFADTWWLCWMADLMGLMLITPVLLTWMGARFLRPVERSHLKSAFLAGALLAVRKAARREPEPRGLVMLDDLAPCHRVSASDGRRQAVSWLKDMRLARSGELSAVPIESALCCAAPVYCCRASAACARTRSSAAARWLRLRRRPISSIRSSFFARLCQRYASSRFCGTPRPAR